MEREQFTFYSSFARAIRRIKKKADRCDAYDAIVEYALAGVEPDLDKLPDAAAIAYVLAKPNIDASRRKAEGGRRGGSAKKAEDAPEGCPKDSGSIAEASAEDTESKNENKNKDKNKIKDKDKCLISPSSPNGDAPPPEKPPRRKHGQYGWVLLTDEEQKRLRDELGVDELARCIRIVDELAQQNGNKYKWKDWNLVLRKCHRENWGRRESAPESNKRFTAQTPYPTAADIHSLELAVRTMERMNAKHKESTS